MWKSHIFFMHLFFDFFCEAKAKPLRYLRLILIMFEAVSRLHVNWRKSMIYPTKELEDIQTMAAILGCAVGSLPTVWFGSKNIALELFNGMVDSYEKRLTSFGQHCSRCFTHLCDVFVSSTSKCKGENWCAEKEFHLTRQQRESS